MTETPAQFLARIGAKFDTQEAYEAALVAVAESQAEIERLRANAVIRGLEKDVSDIIGSLTMARYDEEYRGKSTDPRWEQSARTALNQKQRELIKAIKARAALRSAAR